MIRESGAAYIADEGLIFAIPGYPVCVLSDEGLSRILSDAGGEAGLRLRYNRYADDDLIVGRVYLHPGSGMLIFLDNLRSVDTDRVPGLFAAIMPGALLELFKQDPPGHLLYKAGIPIRVYCWRDVPGGDL